MSDRCRALTHPHQCDHWIWRAYEIQRSYVLPNRRPGVRVHRLACVTVVALGEADAWDRSAEARAICDREAADSGWQAGVSWWLDLARHHESGQILWPHPPQGEGRRAPTTHCALQGLAEP